MSRPRVLVLGDFGIDVMITVPSLPKSDQKFNGVRVAQGAGGMAANVAVALAHLGSPVRLAAALGDDLYADVALHALDQEAIDLNFIYRRRGTPTFMCVVLLAPDGEKALVRLPSAAYLPTVDELTTNLFVDVQHLHTTVGDETLTLRAIDLAAAHHITVSLDLEATDIPTQSKATREILAGIDILFLNKDARQKLGEHLHAQEIPGPRMVVTTLGKEGSLCEVGGHTFNVPGYAVEVRDTTGAGDAFAGAFLHHYLLTGDPKAALRFANVAAALSTQAYGAQTSLATEDDVARYVNSMLDRDIG